jgi:hypothetical protein
LRGFPQRIGWSHSGEAGPKPRALSLFMVLDLVTASAVQNGHELIER